MNDNQEKALKKGCHEREQAWMGVSSTEKTNTKELERCNEIRELLIENRTTGFQGHVSYQDGEWRVSVTRAAVCMGVKGMGM